MPLTPCGVRGVRSGDLVGDARGEGRGDLLGDDNDIRALEVNAASDLAFLALSSK